MKKVALVGRPNVGKSALFNRICRKRLAIVDEAEGITRDRLYAEADCFGTPFEIIDTGGIDPKSTTPFQEQILHQTEVAMAHADRFIMVVDGRVGIHPLDRMVAKMLLRTGKPLVLAVNKIDEEIHNEWIYPFYQLGIEHVIGVSALHGYQIAELLQHHVRGLVSAQTETKQKGIHIALLGRTNVGKSTLLNYLAGEERSIVSDLPGTTRDHIEIQIDHEGTSYHFIDTAGIRRKNKEPETVDKFAAVRTKYALEHSDICILMLDATQGLSTQDKRILTEIEESGKGCILWFNKWDLVQGFRMEHCYLGAVAEAEFIQYCPTIFGAAKTGRNVDKIFTAIDEVYQALQTRITTGQLNRFVEKAIQEVHPPMLQGKRLRIYYLTQVDTFPPRFIFFVNDGRLLASSYRRYLVNQFRKTFGFKGAPLRFFLKGKTKKKKKLGKQAPMEMLALHS